MLNANFVSSILGKSHVPHVVVASEASVAFPSKYAKYVGLKGTYSVDLFEHTLLQTVRDLVPTAYSITGFVKYEDGFHAFVHFNIVNGDAFYIILQNDDSNPLVTHVSCEHVPDVPRGQREAHTQRLPEFDVTAVSSVEDLGSPEFFTACFSELISRLPILTDVEAQKPRAGVFVDGATPTDSFHGFTEKAKVAAELESRSIFHVHKSYARFQSTFDYKGKDHKGLAGVIICKMDNGEHFQISIRPSGKTPFEHRVVVEHGADHKKYDESGKVVSWADQESEQARQMSSVVFTGTFVQGTDAEDIGSVQFFKRLFNAVVKNAPYTEQEDSLAKRVKRI